MAKKSRLNDNAAIYQARDERSEKEQFKAMSGKEKWDHFKQYYLKLSIVGILGLALVVYCIYSFFAPKTQTVLNVAVLDGAIDSDTCETIDTDMTDRLELEDLEDVYIDNSYYISASEYSAQNVQKLSTFLMAREIDVMIAPESTFNNYCKAGYFSTLSDALPTQLFSTLSDNFYYAVGPDEDEDDSTSEDTSTSSDAPTVAYGIKLDGFTVRDNDGNTISNPILGIVVNSKYTDNGAAFVQYLYDEGYIITKDK